MKQTLYQISTLQALSMGYSRAVISVEAFLQHGNIGLGTFEDVNGEMILLDGQCFRASENGAVVRAEPDRGAPSRSQLFFTMVKGFPLRMLKT